MRVFFAAITALAIVWAAPQLTAQEQSGEAIAGAASGAIVIEATAEDDGSGVISNMQIMAIDAGDVGEGAFFMTGDTMGGPLPMAFGGGDSFAMLSNPSVQKDLELVEDQIQQIKDVNADFSARIQDQIGGLQGENGGFDLARAKELGELVKKLKEQQKAEIDNLLLPHQQDRLQQVALQMQMQAMGAARALSSKLAEELGITDEQKDRLKKRQKELQEEMEKKIAKMREDVKQELLQELTSQQREKLKELTGAEFEMKSEDFQRRRSLSPRMRRGGGR